MQDNKTWHLQGVHLGVLDVPKSIEFYTKVWGLELVAVSGNKTLLRAQGRAHHVLTLSEASAKSPGLLGIEFASLGREAIEAVARDAPDFDVRISAGLHERAPELGGGLCLELEGPGGVAVSVVTGAALHPRREVISAKPLKLTHVVLNSDNFEAHERFFCGLLGMRESDRTRHMAFLRSDLDHHSIALAHGDNNRLNHLAFEMADLDSQMYGTGRVIEAGHGLEWGPGRHGPGNNVFCYFVDPDGLAVEYTFEIEQITSTERVPGSAEDWDRFPRRPCRWGVARKPSERLQDAFASRHLQGRQAGAQP